MGIEYLASVFNTILRQTAPILLVALCAGVCSKVKVFNIALEGTLLTSAFFAFLTQYFLRNILLSVLVAMGVAMLLTFIMSFFIVKLNGQPMIVGMAINTFSLGFTTFMLSMIFDTKGTVTITGENAGLPKIALPVIKDIPVLSTMFTNLTAIDYAAFLLAIVMYIIMYKTVIGFRLRAIGINQSAASSLGINVARNQIIATTLSGAMIGLAGCLLSLGSVTLFIQNISSARGYVALAANNLCQGHPIGALLSSLLFGFTQALARVLQNTAIKQQLLECIPYIATIAAMAVYNAIARRRAKAAKL
ncbi:MAG TPA: ABC transporter permease [Candidatus Faecivicinus avistercoris]|nr:ABC transporter permease [Candidatus Faecivicinus avistercoris]